MTGHNLTPKELSGNPVTVYWAAMGAGHCGFSGPWFLVACLQSAPRRLRSGAPCPWMHWPPQPQSEWENFPLSNNDSLQLFFFVFDASHSGSRPRTWSRPLCGLARRRKAPTSAESNGMPSASMGRTLECRCLLSGLSLDPGHGRKLSLPLSHLLAW